VARLAEELSDDEARQKAYDTAVSVCHADGVVNANEAQFLRTLATALSIDGATTDAKADAAAAGATPGASADLDQFILDQAMISAALELLPDTLASIAILPQQLRLVQQIGARHGQQMDMDQVKDLAGAFGIGAAAQVMEKVVRGTLGSVVGTLGRGVLGGWLGGIAGSAAGFAAGASVTFATTYALGHAADQYYRQGRSLSLADMKALFAKFQQDATTVYPRVEARVRELATRGSPSDILRGRA
jgi:uncharacterized protein (DUF697 family)